MRYLYVKSETELKTFIDFIEQTVDIQVSLFGEKLKLIGDYVTHITNCVLHSGGVQLLPVLELNYEVIDFMRSANLGTIDEILNFNRL